MATNGDFIEKNGFQVYSNVLVGSYATGNTIVGNNGLLSNISVGIGTTVIASNSAITISGNINLNTSTGFGIVFPDGTFQTSKMSGSSSNTSVNYQVFTTSGTWTKPATASSNAFVTYLIWGGGGGGGFTGGNFISGGGGGACVYGQIPIASAGATETITVGAAGSGGGGGNGGNSSFGLHGTAYGGGGGGVGTDGGLYGGGGGGWFAAGSTGSSGSNGGNPIAGNIKATINSVYGGGSGGNSQIGPGGSVWGGGGGAGFYPGSTYLLNGGNTYAGGGGGAGVYISNQGFIGVSQLGGNGGGYISGVSFNPTAPGGGGVGNGTGTRGEVRIWTIG